ncbi:DNA-directed RNA polymerase I subunit RPA12 [Petromyzon marinus]|uniref:DNA-directed RNA polymerase subunit n=1 Tax=Petromyzon marinus TaxID=7757 RepID=A0AAJ7UI68_PETMA|nr:DNA-directed RNA polymerase I subunit RPA12 [Petromyzon marinus]
MFHSEPDFCARCGSALPLPVSSASLACRTCRSPVNASALEKVATLSVVKFNNPEGAGQGDEDAVQSRGELTGPTVERRCPRCGGESMAYHTRQTRSADEGQTVFYTCVKCRFQEKEDS